jgi:type II secretory pathway pseudopilin PulG
MERMNSRQSKRGFNLIEAAIVLGVVGLVIGGIWVAAAKFYEDYKVNKMVEDILTIVRNTERLVSYRDAAAIDDANPSPYYNVPYSESSPYFPKDWIKQNYITTPFGGRSQLNIMRDNFSVNIINLGGQMSTSACIKFVTRISHVGSIGRQRSNWYNPSLITITVGTSLGALGMSVFPIKLEQAKSACTMNGGVLALFYLQFRYTRTN